MINKNIFEKVAKGISKKSRGIQSPRTIHPEREWAIGLLVAFLIFSLTTVWSVTSYLHYKDTRADELNSSEIDNSVYRGSLVKSALEEFARREEEQENIFKNGLAGEVPLDVAEETDMEIGEDESNVTEAVGEVESGESSLSNSLPTQTEGVELGQ